MSLPRLPAVLTSIVLMLQPVSTVFLGAVLLSEAPSAVQLLGVAIVIAGVAVATVRPRSEPRRLSDPPVGFPAHHRATPRPGAYPDSPRRRALIRRLFELMETRARPRDAEELIANSAEDVVFQPPPGLKRRSAATTSWRKFWADFAEEGLQMRAGAYAISEEGDAVVVSGWVRTIWSEGRLADTQSRWVYRFNQNDLVVSARVERAG